MELYLLLLIIAIPLIAQSKVKTNYEKFSRIQNSHNMTGYEVARKILDSNGLTDIKKKNANKTKGTKYNRPT